MAVYAVFGSGGGLGEALVRALYERDPEAEIHGFSRRPCPDQLADITNLIWHQYTGEVLDAAAAAVQKWQQEGVFLNGVISTIGWLHRIDADHGEWQPERRLEQLNSEQLQEYFRVNATIPALLIQILKPVLAKKKRCFVVQLGAKVGSIGDNQLGGWYGYRASKAALNMLFKTAAIELKRTHKLLTLAVIHPGTTDTPLSEPFQDRLPKDKLYSPEQSAQRICSVIWNLTPQESGDFWFWDGERLPW
ncbi:SDR family NAD(P)-dependent oxidoreductase [Aliidiomarina halalkaliphila]|uniref:SDR family NAD(P)-dependent oxidoreductase n=1 Tax=Aliidiomarina halalkaliphila TaxID=2593535 RepID=A0A552WZT5_9GAMM|nr:SDR family NAD(P)-dependent oxidoreductase [Aliidiomarina halalkaliphila]TRW48331.1 SDR family NAD(P)-dependent oxidoreductase [Aliidiomarina halalkaliphila]